jgi:hypothetical protein
VPFLTVPIKELTRLSLSESLLPKAISEALGISLAEVLDLYFRDGDEDMQDHLVWEVIDRCRINEEDKRNQVREMYMELPYQRDDTF